MRRVHLLALFAATAVAALLAPGIAHAATITVPFAADSADACRYGTSSGTLGWRYGSTSPLPASAVDVKGQLTDRPLPADPSTACRDDGYYSTVTFTAYAGSVAVDRQSRSTNNGTASFEFTLAANTTTGGLDRVVVQVCRSPINTLPPSYCGKAVTYLAPPIG